MRPLIVLMSTAVLLASCGSKSESSDTSTTTTTTSTEAMAPAAEATASDAAADAMATPPSKSIEDPGDPVPSTGKPTKP